MGSRLTTLWLAAFSGQVAWLLDMEIGYLLVYWACGTKQTWVLPLLTAVAFAIALTGAAVSLLTSRLATPPPHGSADVTTLAGADLSSIERFLGVAGVALNGVAMIVILAMGLPRIMLDPCSR